MTYAALDRWIQPQHLTDAAVARHAAAMAAHPARVLVLDDVLTADRLADLQQVMLATGRLEPVYALAKSTDSRTSADIWHAAPDAQRFYHHLELVGPRPGHELSRSYITHLRFLDVMGSRTFLDYFQRIGGARLDHTGLINGKVLGSAQFLRPHSDAEPGRQLCGVLYLSPDWQPAFGGRFLLYRDGIEVEAIAPVANRLLLFVPSTVYLHAVEPLAPAAGAWQRANYSLWFLADPAAPTPGAP